jgi:uncharacterized membrane protein
VSKKKRKRLRFPQKQMQPQQAQHQVSLPQTTIQGQFFAGPLPPPQELAAYEHITPGLADRIVSMAEKEQNTRHKITQRQNWAQIWITSAGQVFGFILALAIIAIAGWLLAHDKAITGFSALLIGIGTLIGPFLYDKISQRQEPPVS